MIPVYHSYWWKRHWIARTVTQFQCDCIIYELTAYNQNKSGLSRVVKNGNVLCTGRAADSNTVLFWVRNDTTWYFKLSKTRSISPECITGFRIQVALKISRGDSCSQGYGKAATYKYWQKYGSWICRQQRQKTNGALPSWDTSLGEPYGAYDIKKIKLENGTGICKIHFTFIIGRWLRK